MLALPFMASAATISGVGTAIFSGQTNLYGNAGQNVQVNTNFDVPTGQVLHAVQTDFIGDNVPPVCHVVSVVEGAQNNVSVAFSEMLPTNANDYGFTMNAFTAATVPQANALNQNQGTACTGTNSSVYNQGGVVHVLPNGTSGTGSTGSSTGGISTDVKDLIALIKAWMAAQMGGGTGSPAPTPVKQCPPAYPGSSVFTVQGWLVDHGFMTQAQVNTGPGTFGPKTSGAYLSASNACK